MLAGVIAALILVIAYMFLPVPMTHSSLASAKRMKAADLKTKQGELATLKENANPDKLAELETRINNNEALLFEFEARLPKKQEIPNLLYEFQRVAEENGIVFRKIETRDLQSEEGYDKRPFSVETRADYFQAMDLCHVVEYGERIGTVEGFRLEPGLPEDKKVVKSAKDEGPGSYVPQMNVKIDVAIFALQKPAPPSAESGPGATDKSAKSAKSAKSTKKSSKSGGAS